ncbi:MAG: hypothetical protein LLG97_14705 [Deltaproteobacteria bacterium]|nr:hypothetical protein [Deltaproteobacteria bacterium]
MDAAPAADLCRAGTPSDVSGSGPWVWGCAGTDGGASADCVAARTPLEGDINGDGALTTADAVVALKTMARLNGDGIPGNVQTDETDTDADGHIGFSDAIYVLQRLADLRKPLSTSAVGSVTLPAGIGLTHADVQVQAFLGKAAVQANGTYAVTQPASGLVLVMVTDPQERVILMGYCDAVDPGMGRLSALSTATALMFLDIGGPNLPPENWKEVLAMIESAQTVKHLASVIEARLAEDPGALDAGDAAIKAAIATARDILVPVEAREAAAPAALSAALPASSAASRTPLDTTPVQIAVTSANPLSGIQIMSETNGDGLVIQNSYRRHCYYWVFYAGYQDQSGADHLLSSALYEKVASGYLKSTAGLSGVIGTSLDYFVWEKLPYDPVKADPIVLDKAPADAKHGYYKVVAVGGTTVAGLLPPSWAMEDVNRNDYLAMQTLMGVVSVVKDYFLPVAFALSAKDTVNMMAGKDLGEFCTVLVGFFIKAGVNIAQNIAANDYDGAGRALLKAYLTDGELRKAVCKFVASRLLRYVLSAERLEQVSTSAEMYAKILKGFDIAMLGWDLGGVTKDLAVSNGYEYFDVVAVPPDVHVEPSSATLIPNYEKTFHAVKGTIAGDAFEYRWSVKGAGGGGLHREGETAMAGAVTTSAPAVVYKAQADPGDKAEDTVTVEVYRKFVTDAGVVTQYVGTGKAVVTLLNSPTNGIPVAYHFTGPYRWENYVVSLAYFTWPAVEGAYAYELSASGARYAWGDPRPFYTWGYTIPAHCYWTPTPTGGCVHYWGAGREPIPAGFPMPEMPEGTVGYGSIVLDRVNDSVNYAEFLEAYAPEIYMQYRDTYSDAVISAVPKFWGQ